MLQTAKPDDIESRKMLVAAYLLKGRAMASMNKKDEESREYEKAEEVAEALSIYANQKGNQDLEVTSERMRADIQMARRQWEGARTIVEKLVEAQGGGNIAKVDTDLIRRLAHIRSSASRITPAPMTTFESLLDNPRLKPDERGEVIKGFLDSAANERVSLTDRERLTALAIQSADPSPIDNDPIYLARLGWVLQRVRQTE